MENSKTAIPATALQQRILKENSKKSRFRQVHLPPRKSCALSMCHFIYKPKSSWKIGVLLRQFYSFGSDFESFIAYWHAKQLLSQFKGGQREGDFPGISCAAFTRYALSEQTAVLCVFSHDSSLGAQAPFKWVTAHDHLEQINSKESVHFVSKLFSEILGRDPACFSAHGIQGFTFELKSFKLTTSGRTVEVCCLCQLFLLALSFILKD